MGGDFGPCVTVPAALEMLATNVNLYLLLVGHLDALTSLLAKADPLLLTRLQVIPAKFAIANNAKPSQAIHASRGTSMRIALELMKDGIVQGCVSAGNTGALMGLAKLLIKPLEGIRRPALMTMIPNKLCGKTVMLDLGANIECDSTMLVQFAVMGSVVAEEILGIAQPRVALLNIGNEETKGLNCIRNAASILKNTLTVNYIGYLEGHDLLTGKTDVIICDGFIGNVTLKTIEGVAKLFLSLLKTSKNSGKEMWWLKLLSHCLTIRVAKRFAHIHPNQYNGAYLLGLRKTVIKSHGAADLHAFSAAIGQAVQAVQRQVPQRIAARLKTALPKSD